MNMDDERLKKASRSAKGSFLAEVRKNVEKTEKLLKEVEESLLRSKNLEEEKIKYREHMKKKQRAGRNIKLEITDDISHTRLTKDEYEILEKHVEEQELSQELDKEKENEKMIKEIEEEARDERMDKLIKNAVDRARMVAKVNDTYIVYMNDNGDIVREYPDGRIEKVEK